jgi:tRNA(Ile)-lysidine synthase
MAVSPTPKPTPVKSKLVNSAPALTNPALVALQAFAGSGALVLAPPLAVAYSGGADSTALLHAACALWPGQVRAIHVNHDLQAAAAQFENNCTTVCEQLHVPLQVVKVKAGHATGESPEDAARKARYTGLADAARALGVSQVLLGQHADDQVETILLALSRGAGLAGLSAMPAVFERAGVQFLRPLLDVPGASLRDWLTQAGHAFVDDPSNTDERYTRNRIRARLLPALADAFPQFRQTFARSASHAAQAQVVLDEVAAQDLLQVGSPPAIKALQALSRPRQANVLRHWLLVCHQVRPSAAQLAELLDQVAACTTRGHQIHLKVANGHVLRAVSYLQWLAPI